MIEPLYGGHSRTTSSSPCLIRRMYRPTSAVRENWKPLVKGDFEATWRKALHAGFLDGIGFRREDSLREGWRSPPSSPAASDDGFEVIFRPDPNVYDGRFAHMSWLQELPKPVTNLSWDNAALVSMDTIGKLKLHGSRHHRD